jgi:hypothetical protein
MAEFTRLVDGRSVQSVTVNDSVCMDQNGVFDKSVGIAFCENLLGGTWILSSDYVPPPMTESEAQAVVADHLNSVASERGYDSILSACTYALSVTPQFKAEGDACVAWRDAVWIKAYQILGEVQAGTRPVPTPESLVAELPVMVWPS